MTTFTIDTDNNITAFAAPDQAEAVITAGAQPFGSSEELTQLAAGWPAEGLLGIWNSLPGVTPAKEFKNPKAAASKISGRIQSMAEPEKSIDPAPKAERKPKGGAEGGKGAPATVSRERRPPLPRSRPKALRLRNQPNLKLARRAKATRPAMLQRTNGATLAEIMDNMGWQRHTVRGFMAEAMP
jgi:hypothetical protein